MTHVPRRNPCLTALAFVACFPLGGCAGGAEGGGPHPEDAAVDASAAVMDAAPEAASDAADTGAGAPGKDTGESGACAELLTGEGPFGRVLSGSAQFYRQHTVVGQQLPDPREGRLSVLAYFPGGRRAGAPFYLAMPGTYPRPGIFMSKRFALNEDLGVPVLAGLGIGNDLGASWKGALVGPSGGLVGEASLNFAFGTDVADTATAAITLCPGAEVPPAKLLGDDRVFVPTLPLYFAPTAPFDEGNLPAVKVRAGDLEVPVKLTIHRDFSGNNAWLVTPRAAFPPNRAIVLDLAGAHDLLGRPFVLENVPAPLVTTASVKDFTFATTPPFGAVASKGSSLMPLAFIANGQLVFGYSGMAYPGVALVSLGDPGAKTKAVFRIGVDCRPGFGQASLSSTAALVAAGGETTAIPLACGPVREVVISLPGPGPLWLSVVLSPDRGHPQQLPPQGGNAVQVDEIAFE
jgi:hypothetical protein